MCSFEYDLTESCEYCDGSGWVDGDPVRDWNGPYYPQQRCTACNGKRTWTRHMRPIDLGDTYDDI